MGAEASYDLGRTTTHEVGHYFLLEHMWGENGGCNEDDDVSDTPNSSEANYDCPNLGTVSCNSTDMHMNYMDYTNDACMYMFSAGQASRMTNYINSSLSSFTNNASNVILENAGDNTNDGGTDEEGENTGDGTDGEESNNDNTNEQTTGEETNNGNTDEENTDDGNNSEEVDSASTNVACDIISIQITLGNYGSETTWKLKNEYNEVIAKGGPYKDEQNGSVEIENACLDQKGCYSLIIRDTYGDGICCDYGYGQVQVLDAADNLITSSDGYFGRREKLIICRDNQGL